MSINKASISDPRAQVTQWLLSPANENFGKLMQAEVENGGSTLEVSRRNRR